MGFTLSVPDRQYRLDSEAAIGQAIPDSPTLFQGTGAAVGTSVVSGAADVARTAGDTLAASARANAEIGLIENPWADPTGEGLAQLRAEPRPTRGPNDPMQALQDWARADPTTQGGGARAIGGVVRGLEIIGLGSLAGGPFGGVGTLAATEGYNDYRESTAAGIDETTALKKAGVTAAFSGAGALLPLGIGKGAAKTLAGLGMRAEVAGNEALASTYYGAARAAASVATAPRIATAAVINTGFGATNRYVTSQILADAGYKDMAAQYEPLDGQALAADFIMGMAFGGQETINRFTKFVGTSLAKDVAWGYSLLRDRLIPQSAIDAALGTRRQEMLTRNGAGIAVDPATANLDLRLQDESLANLLRGRDTGISSQDAHAVIEGMLPDPGRAEVNDQFIAHMEQEHGLLADVSEPILREAAPLPAETASPLMSEATGEAEGMPGISPVAAESLRQMAARYPDLDIGLNNGTSVRLADLPNLLAQEMAQAHSDAKLHDVAMACFLSTA